MKLRVEFFVVLALLAVLAAPWLLRPTDELQTFDAQDNLVIISPHSESIRQEFTSAFLPYYKEKTGRTLRIDWRIPGGTSEISMVIRGAYRAAFEQHWKKQMQQPWTHESEAFWDSNASPIKGSSREAFLGSNIGVGMDVFFGGGAFDFIAQAKAGALVAETPDQKYGLAVIARQHPEWFRDDVSPPTLSGETLRDKDWRWAGVCLSGFGIVANTDVCARLGLPGPPRAWSDLANPSFYRQIALADPTKSGSVAKAYEMLIQQCMQQNVAQSGETPQALAKGWDEGMKLILKLSANGRYFTDSASKVPHDVAAGEAAAGMCIDFYGLTFNEIKRMSDGSSRVNFAMPPGGTSIGADPIGMFRGAPHPEAAHLFMEFILSPAGQKLWCQRPGTPGGPKTTALRRVPVRRDVFEASQPYLSDPDANVWEHASLFTYHPEWTSTAFAPLRFIIRVACVDPHEEQREAWEAIIDNNFPKQALAEFENVMGIGLSDASGEIAAVLKSKDRIKEVRLAREYALRFRNQYEKARKLAIKQQ